MRIATYLLMQFGFSSLILAIFPLLLHAQDINLFFDMDDNALRLRTKILLFQTTDQTLGTQPMSQEDENKFEEEGKIIKVSTQDFAIVKRLIGKTEPYHNFRIVNSIPHYGSLRYFRDDPINGRNYFLEDINEGLKDPANLMGPSTRALMIALSYKELAKNVHIPTARGFSDKNFFEGLERLQEAGWIKYLPLKENIWNVTSPEFITKFTQTFGEAPPPGEVDSPAGRKSAYMKKRFNQINASPFEHPNELIISPDGDSWGPYKLSGFSDDDYDNFHGGKTEFSRQIVANLWPLIKTTVFFTGLNDPHQKFRTEVIRIDGSARPLIYGEDEEWIRLAIHRYGPIEINPKIGRSEIEALMNACSKNSLK